MRQGTPWLSLVQGLLAKVGSCLEGAHRLLAACPEGCGRAQGQEEKGLPNLPLLTMTAVGAACRCENCGVVGQLVGMPVRLTQQSCGTRTAQIWCKVQPQSACWGLQRPLRWVQDRQALYLSWSKGRYLRQCW